ncbi:MAG: HNH endonuclease [[Clostridium] fimetarium]|nr:HNH endonuclease [Alistipes timonensis]MCM1405728.1 HNH endonuclease [[Clostridium] fimetarium]
MIEHLSYAEKLEDENWSKKRYEILRRDNCQCRMCGASKQLEVHHRFYIYKADPWEYPNDALVTLCRSCHELVHKTLPPLIYANKFGGLIRMMFTPCKRCSGYGYLSEYRHINNGICFRCHGHRFEELITPKSVSLTLADESAEIFDTLTTITNAETLFRIGKKFHFEDKDKAKSYYYKSAIYGSAKAQNNLGLIFQEDGRIEEAKRLFLYSAMQGVNQGIQNLGMLLKKEGDLDLLSKWLPILKNNKHFVCRIAFEYFFKFLQDNGEKPSLNEFISSVDTLINLASSGFKPAAKIVDEFKIRDIQKSIVEEFEKSASADNL